ncbi:MAG: alpha/beta hydrolase [Simkaniaceae bacterium]|nr:alpha/beta hydrolase [Simkaniaceae bacterium]MCF7852880.1 alpha/beta hydrolase [Simkaniaceae bacterium]
MWASNDAYQVYYEVHGDKHPLVLLHGLARDHTSWYPFLDVLKQYYQVILIDHIGSGQSIYHKKSISMSDMAEAIHLVLEQLNLGAVDLIGNSMGGFVAQHIAINYPLSIHRLGLVASTAHQRSIARLSMETTVEFRRRDMPLDLILKSFIPLAFSPSFLSDENVIAEIIKNILSDENPQSFEAFEAQVHACQKHDTRALLHKIKHPTWICSGSFDLLATEDEAQELHRNIAGSKLSILEGIGHSIPYEVPKRFLEELLAHFKKSPS